MFFRVETNYFRSKGWTWGMSLSPDENKISVPCSLCGRGHLYPGRYPELPLFVKGEGGAGYPDLLGCTSRLIVSETVVQDWQENSITGFETYPVYVTKATGEEIEIIDPPAYYHIKVNGRVALDYEAMGIRITYLCPVCGYRTEEMVNETPEQALENPFGEFPFILRQDTWDGSDLFLSEAFGRTIFCSQKVYDLATHRRRTGFLFEPIAAY